VDTRYLTDGGISRPSANQDRGVVSDYHVMVSADMTFLNTICRVYRFFGVSLETQKARLSREFQLGKTAG
jgi:hypothetical protein